MPTLNRAPNEREQQKLIEIFLKAETDIINEIGRLRSMGNVDYHAVATLERVQAILRKMESDSWEYVPRMIEQMFYVRVPEARRIAGETPAKHFMGYINAMSLTGEQTAIVDTLVQNLMGEITDSAMTAMATVQSAVVGRTEPDVYGWGWSRWPICRPQGAGRTSPCPDLWRPCGGRASRPLWTGWGATGLYIPTAPW